jgi:hypothetical protein
LCLEQGSEYADHYVIQWMLEGGEWADSAQRCQACLSWEGLDNGTVYSFRAKGVNYVGQTDLSGQVSAMPIPPPTNLDGGSDFECIHLWWDGDIYASGYKVYYWESPPILGTQCVDVGDTTATTLGGLENGMLYNVYVTAYDEFGTQTDNSNLVSIRPNCWGR